jgi:hypothetical protein
MGSEQEEEQADGEGRKEEREKRGSHSPLTMKPLISPLNRLTSHDTNTPPPGILTIVWLLLLLGSQDPIRERESLFLTHHHLIDTDFGYEIHFYRGLLCYIVRGYLTKASRLQ